MMFSQEYSSKSAQLAIGADHAREGDVEASEQNKAMQTI